MQYPLIFSTWFNLELEIELLLKHLKADQKKRIVLAFDQDPFLQTVRVMVQERASSLDLEIISDESLDLNAADFR